jgi:hypothetical protein
MANYADYLRSQGASEADITILDTPLARKAHEAMEARIAKAIDDANASITDYKTKVDTWYNDSIMPEVERTRAEATKAAAEAARARALILSSQDEGLKRVAKDLGYLIDPAAPRTDPNAAPAFDASKYVPRSELQGIAESVGESLAQMQDMVADHMQLFPGQRLNVTALRREALAAKKNVFEFWEQKYKVADARAAAAAAAAKAHDDAIRKEASDAVRAEMASQYGSPDSRPLMPSQSPFAARPATGRDKAPWDKTEDENSADRVSRTTKHVMEMLTRPN